MPFEFEPLRVTSHGHETVLRGRVVAGAYFGPEAVVARSTQGQELSTHIHSHVLEYPAGWPVLPEHAKTTLVLAIPALPPGFELALLKGIGTVASGKASADRTEWLQEPKFWANQLLLHCASDQVAEPSAAWLGIEAKDASSWYLNEIEALFKEGAHPFVRAALPRGRYIELELAGGVEYQDRIWIGSYEGERVLLGYHSGHFSLPALSTAELTSLAEETDFAASNLLWLSATYVTEATQLAAFAERLSARLPGLTHGSERAVAQALLARITVPEISWSHDPERGNVNNWPYSQRNPQSQLSLLKPADFAFIQRFFTA